jgi:CubicO group peptidase (beta-lactamase class C family)
VSAKRALEELLEAATTDGTTPALSCVVSGGARDGPRFSWSGGVTTDEEVALPVSHDTVFDLASLTKVISTTTLCAYAVELGRLDLDEKPWPRWPDVTVRNALLHDGGLLWWRAFYEDVPATIAGTPAGRDHVLHDVLSTPPDGDPNLETVYSDLGFIALGALLEERLGNRLDRLFSQLAADCYGETGLRYVPLAELGYHPSLPDVAATSRSELRGRLIQGQVHDDNTFAMGGIAGHAGLFGSAQDVEAAARYHLALPERMRAFSTWDGPRRLGWDRPTDGGSTGGALSDDAFGHLGFTGTSLWLDPAGPTDGGALYVLLTNRVCPSVANERIRVLRPEFHRAARAFLDENA